MSKETIYVVAVCQEFKSANHKNLWLELSKYHKVVVVDIPADYVVSAIKRKKYRIQEAKEGARQVTDNLYVVRPLLLLRHELIPVAFKFYVSKVFWKSVAKCIPNYSNCRIKFLTYDGIWNRILDFKGLDVVKGYYLYDEVRNNGNDNSVNMKRYINDEHACKNSDIIFTMTDVLTESRRCYNNNIITVGNGSVYIPNIKNTIKLPRSIAFIGNFRDWVDNQLLEELIKLRQDVIFAFAGSIEGNMMPFFEHLINTYDNVLFMGRYSKERMPSLYKNFSAVIIPYQHNEFVQATRPIKIVESIMAGTPVITVPMAGYKSGNFIRFADNVADFSTQIDYVLSNPIDINCQEYKNFVISNTWESIARIIEDKLA